METIVEKPTHFQALFQKQQAFAPQLANTSAAQRIERLNRIIRFLDNEQEMQGLKEAMYHDFRKAEVEVILSEIAVVKSHALHTRRELRRWMRPHRVPTPLTLFGTTSYIQYEAKGACLIISPWNYPFNLTFSPLIYAIAAGNTAIIKPSELTPHTSTFMARAVQKLFPAEEVALLEGDASLATALLELPFDHIFFTGSPQIGKIIMAAAAKNLASVTLELGGKSPAIIDSSAAIAKQAYHMAWGKCLNNGQTCIAPDYALVHQSKLDEFVQAYQAGLQRLYSDTANLMHNPDYCRIVSPRHYQRLRRLYEDALSKGATELLGGTWNEAELFVPPTLLGNISAEMQIMEEEIFGPILPVLPFASAEEVVQIIRQRPKPLSLYISARNRRFIRYIMENTSAGGTVINDFMLGYGNPNLPFGGVNNSGIGKYMGFHGFVAFSNEKAVVKRNFGTLSILFPPYTPRVRALMQFVQKRLL
jgi:aldehyde dehydrogenase (NAD+)